MNFQGASKHAKRMRSLSGPGAMRLLSKALFVAGDTVRVAAQIKITEGAVSGKNHVASKPGEAPNQDTGVLGNNIEVEQPQDFTVEVVSKAPYARALEFGTSRVAERPYMRPAREETRDEIQKLFERVKREIIRRSGDGRL